MAAPGTLGLQELCLSFYLDTAKPAAVRGEQTHHPRSEPDRLPKRTQASDGHDWHTGASAGLSRWPGASGKCENEGHLSGFDWGEQKVGFVLKSLVSIHNSGVHGYSFIHIHHCVTLFSCSSFSPLYLPISLMRFIRAHLGSKTACAQGTVMPPLHTTQVPKFK